LSDSKGCLNITFSHEYIEEASSWIEGVRMALDKEAIKRMFPNLAKELEVEDNKVPINSVRTDAPAGEEAVSRKFVHYLPDVVDFIRRCDTDEQGLEITAYLEKRGEIDMQYANRLRKQLREKGVRSFGPKKESDYYLKHGEP
jgi:hypothetical protein